MKKNVVLSVLVIASFFIVLPAYGAEIISPTQGDQNLTISSQETHKNLYTAGAKVSVNSIIDGDLVVAGSEVTIEGEVKQDILGAAGNLRINGPTGGDARIAGGTVYVNNKINGDLIVAGGSVTLGDKGEVTGDVVAAGGSVVIDGPVRGSLRATGGEITVNNIIGGAISARSQRLIFGQHAQANGKIFYKGQQEAEIRPGAQVGSIEFVKIAKPALKDEFKKLVAGAFVIKLIAWIFAGLLLLKLRKRLVQRVLSSVTGNPWRDLGLGIAGFVGVPLAILVALLLIVGYYIAFVGLVGYILVLSLTGIIAAFILGALVIRFLTKSVESVIDWQAVVIGVVLWHIISWIPVVGWIITALLSLAVLGALVTIIKDDLSAHQSEGVLQ